MDYKEKERLTREQIKKDITFAMSQWVDMTEKESNKGIIPAILLVCATIISGFFLDRYIIVFFLPGAAILCSLVLVTKFCLRRYRAKHSSIDEYEIVTDILAGVSHEDYRIGGGGRGGGRSRTVHIYALLFESGKRWQLPNRLYAREADEGRKALVVYENCHRGDMFILAIEKKSGKLAMAYNALFFEYDFDHSEN